MGRFYHQIDPTEALIHYVLEAPRQPQSECQALRLSRTRANRDFTDGLYRRLGSGLLTLEVR